MNTRNIDTIPFESFSLVDSDEIYSILFISNNMRSIDIDIIFLDKRKYLYSITEHKIVLSIFVASNTFYKGSHISKMSSIYDISSIIVRYLSEKMIIEG